MTTLARPRSPSRMIPDPQSTRRLRSVALLCFLALVVLAIVDTAARL